MKNKDHKTNPNYIRENAKSANDIWFSRNPTPIGEDEQDFIKTGLLCMEEYAKQEAMEFANWMGFHFYRINNWMWREIRDESNQTRYNIKELYKQFKKLK